MRKTVFWVFYIILVLLGLAFLELNRNTVMGWELFLLWTVMFGLQYRSRIQHFSLPNKALSWVVFVIMSAAIFWLSWPEPKAVPAVSGDHPEPTEVIHTAKGDVSGLLTADGAVEVFAGIPYAKPPVKELRWKPPVEAEAWEGVRACTEFAPMSMQVTSLPIVDSLTRIIGYHDFPFFSLSDNHTFPVSEDSLYLNIWKPHTEETGLPVLVYIHGGSLQTGQPWYDDYSGESFARSGVVAVNMAYRLGVFGFYADEELLKEDGTTGNYGLLDQIAALKWVKENIAQFGGDPENITICGESAGAVCVDALCVSPLARGMFQKAILESSTLSSVKPPHSFRLLDDALTSGNELRERMHAADVNALRSISAEQLVKEASSQHHVTVDGMVLPETPYELRKKGIHNEQAILHGFNTEESGPFILMNHATAASYEEKLSQVYGPMAERVKELYPGNSDEQAKENWKIVYGAKYFNYPHQCLNRLMAAQEPVYEYLFAKQNGRLGAWHSGELVYAFNRIPEQSTLYTDADRRLSELMHQYWLNFIRNGDPNAEGLPVFEENRSSDRILQLNDTVSMIAEPYLDLYQIIDQNEGFAAD